jgi:hypothetical protein
MNIAITRNYEKREAIIARLERAVASAEYTFILNKKYEGSVRDHVCFTSASYDLKIARRDLAEAKK